MTQPTQDPWLPWLTGLGLPLLVIAIGAFVKRFFATVTRDELRQAIQDSNKIVDERHAEHLKRLDRQDEELKQIRVAVSRIDISGRYPKVQ